MEWKPIESAPLDRPVTIKTRKGRVFKAAFDAEVEGENGSVFAWAEAKEDTAPACWSDGICWAVNADLQPSDPPVAWRP